MSTADHKEDSYEKSGIIKHSQMTNSFSYYQENTCKDYLGMQHLECEIEILQLYILAMDIWAEHLKDLTRKYLSVKHDKFEKPTENLK